MLEKENLQKQIFKKTEYQENCLYGKFKDSNVNQSFNRISRSKNKTLIIITAIIEILLHGYIIYRFLKNQDLYNFNPTNFTIFTGILLLINTISIIIIIVSNENSIFFDIFQLISYFSSLIHYVACLFLVSTGLEIDKIMVFSRVLMITYFLKYVKFTIMNFYSRTLVFITFLAYFSITLITSHTVKKYNLSPLGNCNSNFYCSKFMTVNDELSIYFNEIQNFNDNLSDNSVSKNLNLKFTSEQELNVYILEVLNLKNKMENPFLYFCSLKFLQKSSTAKLLFDHSYNLHKNKSSFCNDEIYLFTEIFFCITVFFVSIFTKQGFYKCFRDLFAHIINDTLLKTYNDDILNNLNINIISMKKKEIIISNNTLNKNLDLYNELFIKSFISENNQDYNLDDINSYKHLYDNNNILMQQFLKLLKLVDKHTFDDENLNLNKIYDEYDNNNNNNEYSLDLILKKFKEITDKSTENNINTESNLIDRNQNDMKKNVYFRKFNTYLDSLKNVESLNINESVDVTILNNEEKLNKFQCLGVFSLNKTTYFKIYSRILFFHEDDTECITDLLIYDITEIKIKEIEKMNKEVELKQKFFCKMAHEFKTPILVIQSLVDQSESCDELQKKENSKHIINMSNYISHLINDIIHYTNIETLKVNINEVKILDLLDFAESIGNSYKKVMACNKDDLKITSQYDPEVDNYIIKSDTSRIQQVILNLVSNAVKFTKFGEIKIYSKIEQNDHQSNEYLSLYVEDTGIGMKNEDLSKLQDDNNEVISIDTKYDYNQMGTGIGISIVKSILRKLNHKIEIFSTYGKGTKFKIMMENIVKKPPNPINYLNESKELLSSNELKDSNNECNINDIVLSKKTKYANTNSQNEDKIISFKICPNTNSSRLTNNFSINHDINFYNINYDEIMNTYKSNKIDEDDNARIKIPKKKVLNLFKNLTNEITDCNNYKLNNNNTLEENLEDSCFQISVLGSSVSNDISKLKKKYKILVVDDYILIRKSIIKVFNMIKNFENDYQLIEGCDGIDILKNIKDDQGHGNEIIGIISDENMEYLQGSKAFLTLKDLEKRQKIKEIKKISLTAFSDESTLKEMRNNGSDEIFNKPLTFDNAKIILSIISKFNTSENDYNTLK